MKHDFSWLCNCCGKPRGRGIDHTECSRIRQAQHANDKRPQKHKRLSDKQLRYLSDALVLL